MDLTEINIQKSGRNGHKLKHDKADYSQPPRHDTSCLHGKLGRCQVEPPRAATASHAAATRLLARHHLRTPLHDASDRLPTSSHHPLTNTDHHRLATCPGHVVPQLRATTACPPPTASSSPFCHLTLLPTPPTASPSLFRHLLPPTATMLRHLVLA